VRLRRRLPGQRRQRQLPAELPHGPGRRNGAPGLPRSERGLRRHQRDGGLSLPPRLRRRPRRDGRGLPGLRRRLPGQRCRRNLHDGLACVLGCDDASGTARCTCAAGEQDNDGDGTCTADCTTAALACDAAAHRVCDDASGTARCACETGTYDDGMGTCRTAGTGDGDGCAFAMDLDLAAEVVYVETTGASPTHSFSCNSMGFSLRDVFYRVHLGAGETRRVRFTLERVDVAGVSFTPALAVLSGATCDTGTEIACGFGFDPETYTRSSAAIDVTLDGGTAGTDYYLVVGTYDRRGRAIRGILRIEQLCDGGGVYSALLDACVDDPCNPTNPCTAPHRTRCAADVSTATPTYECLCDVGYFDDAGACTANASAAGDGCADVAPIEVLEGEGWVDGSTADAIARRATASTASRSTARPASASPSPATRATTA
jgi:hypothetical protein